MSLHFRDYIKQLYQGTSPHISNRVHETHGEIFFESMQKLLSKIQPAQNDIFYDLGSGLGKLVMQVFLTTSVKEACGIELIPGLHTQALHCAEKVKNDFPDYFEPQRKLTFLQGNFLEYELAATIIFINSVCFTQSMLNEIGKQIDNTPTIHTLLSLRPILTLQRLKFKKRYRIEGSWDSALCYIYQ